jgi:hypothetical protein
MPTEAVVAAPFLFLICQAGRASDDARPGDRSPYLLLFVLVFMRYGMTVFKKTALSFLVQRAIPVIPAVTFPSHISSLQNDAKVALSFAGKTQALGIKACATTHLLTVVGLM